MAADPPGAPQTMVPQEPVDRVKLLPDGRPPAGVRRTDRARGAWRLSVFTCVVLSALTVMLFGLALTTMYRVRMLEAEIGEVREQLRGMMAGSVVFPDDDYVESVLDEQEMASLLDYLDPITEGLEKQRTKREDVASGEQPDQISRTTEDYFYSPQLEDATDPFPSRRRTRIRYPPARTSRYGSQMEEPQEGYRPWTSKPEKRRMRLMPSIHLHGDTSRYKYGEHPNYNGNGHLHHPDKLIVDWIQHDWVRELGMDQHFSLDNGALTIRESGLYFIYAQIYYIDSHDSAGFSVNKNGVPILQCAKETKTEFPANKTNTCFTAGAEFLRENDSITIEEIYHQRYSIFKAGKSFFGLTKLGDRRP